MAIINLKKKENRDLTITKHLAGPRLKREGKTINVMIAFYCRKKHDSKDQLCPKCQELYEYALRRLEKCPFREKKPTCTKCPVHCYRAVMRQKIQEVMRYSGPRMIYMYPLMAISHLIDGRRSGVSI